MNYVLISQKSQITCRVLPGAHALSGCNTTSSFFGNGKKLVYKILKDAASDFHDLDNLGDPDKDVAISCSSRFVARPYDQKSFASSHHNINKLRVKLATGRDASLVRLPPSEAALRQHILCASLQTKVFLSGKITSAFTNGIRMVNCQGFFASSLLRRKHASRISP